MSAAADGGDGAAEGRRSVVVVSPDLLPLPGLQTTGAGLRAWGIGQGLAARGHDVVFAMPESTTRACAWSGHESVLVYADGQLDDLLESRMPDAVVFQHWLYAATLRRPYRHTVIDMHGPLLMEILFQGKDLGPFIERKLAVLGAADFFTCAGARQKHYFHAWLLMAGRDLHRSPLEVVRFSLAPELPEHHYPEEPEFVFAGTFLPWQDPSEGLRILIEELERQQRGRLSFFGSYHPWIEMARIPAFERVVAAIETSSRATRSPAIPRDELVDRYRRASVAWDLMPANCEREMAFTSRTAEYLWAGLPVVQQDYSELAELIAEYEAGWVVDPHDEVAVRELVREILASPGEVIRRGRCAQELARDHLNWTRNVEPIDRFLRNPELYGARHRAGEKADNPGPPRT